MMIEQYHGAMHNRAAFFFFFLKTGVQVGLKRQHDYKETETEVSLHTAHL